jgi:leader peptidase (prepilin peptidase) / N-methyltransferase
MPTRMAVMASIALALLAGANPAVPFASGMAIALLVPAAMIDVQTQRLPDTWVGAAAAVFLGSAGVAWAIGQGVADATGIVIGALMLSMPLLTLHVLSPASMGFGDVKAAIVLGASLGAVDWQLTLGALALAAGATATVGIVRGVRHIAFGPGLVGGSLIALWAHDLLIRN